MHCYLNTPHIPHDCSSVILWKKQTYGHRKIPVVGSNKGKGMERQSAESSRGTGQPCNTIMYYYYILVPIHERTILGMTHAVHRGWGAPGALGHHDWCVRVHQLLQRISGEEAVQVGGKLIWKNVCSFLSVMCLRPRTNKRR